MKIVVLDGYPENPGDLSWDEIASFGELTVYDRTSCTDDKEIQERIGDAEVVFTNKTPVRRETFEKCPNLKLISMLATGYDVIDLKAAEEHGVTVCNVPVYGVRR